MAQKEIQAILIIEVAGKPSEYVKDGLEKHLSKVDKMQDIQVVSKNFSEPKRTEHQEEVYTAFCELEVKVPNLAKLMDLIFDLMPSSVEIVDPSRINMDSLEATNFINNLAGRLHRYDEIAKIAQFKIKQLTDELNKAKKS